MKRYGHCSRTRLRSDADETERSSTSKATCGTVRTRSGTGASGSKRLHYDSVGARFISRQEGRVALDQAQFVLFRGGRARTGCASGDATTGVAATSHWLGVFHRSVINVHPALEALAIVHGDRPRSPKEQARRLLVRFKTLVVVQRAQSTLVAWKLENFSSNHGARVLA